MRIHPARALLAVALLVTGSAGLLAHSGAKGIVKERMEAMKAIGKAMKSLGAMAKGETKLRERNIRDAAATIASHAEKIGDLFPDAPNSRKSHVTEAAPTIWEYNQEFLKIANVLTKEAKSLNAIAATKDRSQLGRQLGALGATCKSCHKKFRIKKN